MVIGMVDWEPVVVAIAGGITVLATSAATLIQAIANGRKIQSTHQLVNGGLDDLRNRVASIELGMRGQINSAPPVKGVGNVNTDTGTGSGGASPPTRTS